MTISSQFPHLHSQVTIQGNVCLELDSQNPLALALTLALASVHCVCIVVPGLFDLLNVFQDHIVESDILIPQL